MNEEMYQAELARIYSEMQKQDPTDVTYEKLMQRMAELVDLQKESLQTTLDEKRIKVEEQKVKKQGRLTANDIIGMVTNLIGIGLILNHEKLNVISTKALGFVKKLKV